MKKLSALCLFPALLLLTSSPVPGSAARVFALYALPIKSHFIMMDELLKGLAATGRHRIDLVSMLEPDAGPELGRYRDNYTQIVKLPSIAEELGMGSEQMNFDYLVNFRGNLSVLGRIGYKSCECLGHPDMLRLAREPPQDPPYDVIVLHFSVSPCFAILGHLWRVPIVYLSTTALYPWMHDMSGNPENAAISPNNLLAVPEGNGLWPRLVNTALLTLAKANYLYQTTDQDELLARYFGPQALGIRELERRSVGLVLTNTYFPVNGVKPTTTGVIEVGGLHIRENDGTDLDGELKQWLDESESGVIYMNFGSIIKLDILPDELLGIIFKTLGDIAPIRVLARIANPEKLSRKVPKNFLSLPWIPQQKVLQHPNILAFITHGGLLGTQEAIYYGVPMICMPAIVDQWTNSYNYVRQKIAVLVGLAHTTQENFDAAVTEILNNTIYRENVKRLSALFRDRPNSALDTAIFWIEFVIRNGGDSLRSPAMELSWWQLALIDVYAVVFGVLLSVAFLLACALRALAKFAMRRFINLAAKEKKVN